MERYTQNLNKLNILIIATYFPPDRSIASVRPYMFAKYLISAGHKVTVLCPINDEIEKDNSYKIPKELTIKYFNESSKKGKQTQNPKKNSTAFDKNLIYYIKTVFQIAKNYTIKYSKFLNGLKLYKKDFINYIESDVYFKKHTFDIVFSTFCNIENIKIGNYLRNKFKCKWIMDFRDKVCSPLFGNKILYPFFERIEKLGITKSDWITSVSNGLTKYYKEKYKINNISTIYNGYDKIMSATQCKDNKLGQIINSQKLILCYTGGIYSNERVKSLKKLFCAFQYLLSNHTIKQENILCIYAGNNEYIFNKILREYNLDNLGYSIGKASQKMVNQIQSISDIFTLSSWNTKKEKGILTGKFYEGIRADKPILACITGECPNSELYQLNQKYNYGFCYEQSRGKDAFDKLCDWILKMYNEKMQNGYIDFNQSDAIKEKFHYKNLTKELEQICQQLITE